MSERPLGTVEVLERASKDGAHALSNLLAGGQALSQRSDLDVVKKQIKHRALASQKKAARLREKETSAVPPRRMLIVGATEKGQSLARELSVNFPTDYAVVGFVEDKAEPVADATSQILGGRHELDELVQHHQIDEVVIADCLTENSTANHLYDSAAALEVPQAVASPLNRGLKRAFDIVVSLVALIIGLPMAAVIAIGTKLTSPGPIMYNQKRVGLNGQEFTIYKFRSMHVDAETASGPVLSRRDDERTTWFGKIMRASHADEWPQFYNVLKGDMSIVGPRPERMIFVEKYNQYIPAYPQRHLVRPGITGLAQVNAGYLTHTYVKLHYDLTYIYSQNLWLDLCILAKTPIFILKTARRKEI